MKADTEVKYQRIGELNPGAGVPLVVAALTAPLLGTSKRWPGVFHAIEMEEVVRAWPDGTVTAACGAARLRCVAQGGMIAPWPIRVKGLPEGWSRCKECHELTGRKRPRSAFMGKA